MYHGFPCMTETILPRRHDPQKQIMRLRSDPVSLLEGSASAVGVPGGEAAGGGGQGLAPSAAQVHRGVIDGY